MELAVQLLVPVQLQSRERLLQKLQKEGRPSEYQEQLKELLPLFSLGLLQESIEFSSSFIMMDMTCFQELAVTPDKSLVELAIGALIVKSLWGVDLSKILGLPLGALL